jgi:hypothetical protein
LTPVSGDVDCEEVRFHQGMHFDLMIIEEAVDQEEE